MNRIYWTGQNKPFKRFLAELERAELSKSAAAYVWRCFDWPTPYEQNSPLPQRPDDVCKRLLLSLGLSKRQGFDVLYRALMICRSDKLAAAHMKEQIIPRIAVSERMNAFRVEDRITTAVEWCRTQAPLKGILTLLPDVSYPTQSARFLGIVGMLLSPHYLRHLYYHMEAARYLLYGMGMPVTLKGVDILLSCIQILLMDPLRKVDAITLYRETGRGQVETQSSLIRYVIKRSWQRSRARLEFVMGHTCPKPPTNLQFIQNITGYIIDECENGKLYNLCGYEGGGPAWEERGMTPRIYPSRT